MSEFSKDGFSKSPRNLYWKLYRLLWAVFSFLFFRWSPWFLFGWRRYILRLFGARIGRNVVVYPSVKIWAPCNLIIGDNSCLSHNVDCYNQGIIRIGKNSVVSQRSFLCSATHDYSKYSLPLIVKNITIGDFVWICAEAFIGPSVFLQDGCVVGARAVVVKDVNSYCIVAGNPAVFVRKRHISSDI
jgi:putative colanic acid biosynthesis acetyltransferase WcaF